MVVVMGDKARVGRQELVSTKYGCFDIFGFVVI